MSPEKNIQNNPYQPERPLTTIEEYVLDMGNRFSDAVRTDSAYTQLQDGIAALDYDIAQLGRYPDEADTVGKLQLHRDEQERQFQDRKLLLVSLWEEAHGDEGVFTRLIRLEDLRVELEADPEKTELLDEYRDAKSDLEAYRHGTGGPHPSSE